MLLYALLPSVTFIVLLFCEARQKNKCSGKRFTFADWLLSLSGFWMQGVVIPVLGYLLSSKLFPSFFPELQGILPVGFLGAFLLNFIGIDFLYYLQHRSFHQIPWLWNLHAPHHYSPTVNVWATSRNAIITNFLFVYILVNPFIAYLCDSTEGFFAGAMMTASLDLFRHTSLHIRAPLLNRLFILPQHHHRHHDAEKPFANYGANWCIWDRLFGTLDLSCCTTHIYAIKDTPSLSTQLLFPWKA